MSSSLYRRVTVGFAALTGLLGAGLIGIGAAFGILVVLLVIAVVFLVVRQRKKRGSIEMAGMPGGMPAARTVSNKSTNYEQFDDAEVTSAGGVTLKSSGAIVEP